MFGTCRRWPTAAASEQDSVDRPYLLHGTPICDVLHTLIASLRFSRRIGTTGRRSVTLNISSLELAFIFELVLGTTDRTYLNQKLSASVDLLAASYGLA